MQDLYEPLAGKVALVTGGTDGIGRQVVILQANMGAKTYVVCRNPAKGESLKSSLNGSRAFHNVDFLYGDLSSLQDVRRIAQHFLRLDEPLHLLINNAGVLASPERRQSADGIEATLAVNFIAPYLLTSLLLERMERSAPARIVNVVSLVYQTLRPAVIEKALSDIGADHAYSYSRQYALSKLALIYFTRLLARRLRSTQVTANCMVPGIVFTKLNANPSFSLRLLIGWLRLTKPRNFKTIDQAAHGYTYLCAAPEISAITGQLFKDREILKWTPLAADDDLARKFMDIAGDFSGYAFPPEQKH